MLEANSGPDRWEPADRRSGTDRRRHERRRATRTVKIERRTGRDRRHGQRRSGQERRGVAHHPATTSKRRATLIPYSHHDTLGIQEMASQHRTLTCPLCGGDLSLGPAIPRVNTTVREARCPTCRRGVMVRE